MYYRYYILNKTRNTSGWMETQEELEVGMTVMVRFDNADIIELCECVILKKEKGLES